MRGKKTGGRQKGVPNKATAAKAAAIARSGESPLDYMLRVMRNVKADLTTRLDAAKSAAPYVHPKLAAISHSGSIGTYDLSRVPTDALRQLENILGAAALVGADTSGDSET